MAIRNNAMASVARPCWPSKLPRSFAANVPILGSCMSRRCASATPPQLDAQAAAAPDQVGDVLRPARARAQWWRAAPWPRRPGDPSGAVAPREQVAALGHAARAAPRRGGPRGRPSGVRAVAHACADQAPPLRCVLSPCAPPAHMEHRPERRGRPYLEAPRASGMAMAGLTLAWTGPARTVQWHA